LKLDGKETQKYSGNGARKQMTFILFLYYLFLLTCFNYLRQEIDCKSLYIRNVFICRCS